VTPPVAPPQGPSGGACDGRCKPAGRYDRTYSGDCQKAQSGKKPTCTAKGSPDTGARPGVFSSAPTLCADAGIAHIGYLVATQWGRKL
jgi:hypothetical protein